MEFFAINTASHQAEPTNLLLIVILSALMAFTSLSTDVYLAAMPQMQQDLNGDAELTITGFLIGFTIAQLFWGPISDRIGRKKPLYIGMVLFVIGSIGCALSYSIEQMVFWRIFQAFGACTGPMLARAIIRDKFGRSQAAYMLSTLFMIMAIAPIAGPILGGQILLFSTWHTIFWLLAAIGTIMLSVLILLPESLPEEKRITAPLSHSFKHYWLLLGNSAFVQFTLCVAFYYVGAYAFITGSAHVYISYFGVSPEYYGWLFAINIVGIVSMSFFNRKLIRRFAMEKLLMVACSIAALAVILLTILACLDAASLPVVVFLVFIYFSMNGVIAACATSSALELVPELAGSGSALIGSLQYGSGIISSLLLAMASDKSSFTMILIMAIFGTFSALMAVLAHKSSRRHSA